jgi:predicted nucleic acid-binding Zn ribbon protein
VVEGVARSLRGSSARASLTVFTAWPAAVGPQIEAHAAPVSFDDGRLVVEVDLPGWATQLRYLEAELLAKLDELLGAAVVTAIDVRVGRG